MFIISFHFQTILQKLAAVSIQAHVAHIIPNLINQKCFLVIITTLQDGTKDKGAILVIYQVVVVDQNLVNQLED